MRTAFWSLMARFFGWLSKAAYCWHHDCRRREGKSLTALIEHKEKRSLQHKAYDTSFVLALSAKSKVEVTSCASEVVGAEAEDAG